MKPKYSNLDFFQMPKWDTKNIICAKKFNAQVSV